MKGKRRRHSAELKVKVAVAAIRGVSTVQEIAGQYEVHPTLVAKWKKEALAGLPTVFSNGAAKQDKDEERQREQLRIPGENDHPFRSNPITCSDGKRSPIPIQSDHRFRRNPITCFGAIRSLLGGGSDAG